MRELPCNKSAEQKREDLKTLVTVAPQVISLRSYGRNNGSMKAFRAYQYPNRLFYLDAFQDKENYFEKVIDEFAKISEQLHSRAELTIARKIYDANLKKVEGHALLLKLNDLTFFDNRFLLGIYSEEECTIKNPHFFIKDLPKQSFFSIIKSLV